MGSSRSFATALVALTLGLSAGTRTARAEEPDAGTRMAARELAMAGADAFDKRDFTTALDRFQRAESLYKVPSIAVMVARTLARLGRVVEAVDKYEETQRMPLEAGAPEAFQRAVADAGAEVEPARARVARIELHLPADAPPKTFLTLDDKPVPAALIGVATPVDPGVHHVSAHAAGREPYSSDVTLAEGGRQVVEISLPLQQPALGQPSAPLAEKPAHHGPSTLTLGLLAGGGVAIAAGAATGIAALNHKSRLDAACSPGCPANMSSDLDAFRTDRALSYVGFGVGLAAVGAGTYLLLRGGASGRQVGALVMPGGAAVVGSF